MVGKRKYLSSGMSENPALERGSVRSCTGRNLKRMEVEAITVHSSRKNLLPFSTMDISELLARFNADRPLVINRAGSATVARLACAAVSSGRRVAVVVRSREELASMRGLVSLFTPELSVGRPDSPAQGSPQAAEAPLWEKPWAVLPPFNTRSLSREGWAGRMAVLYALSGRKSRGVILSADNLLPLLPPLDFFAGRELNNLAFFHFSTLQTVFIVSIFVLKSQHFCRVAFCKLAAGAAHTSALPEKFFNFANQSLFFLF